jgi:hypothetical protein
MSRDFYEKKIPSVVNPMTQPPLQSTQYVHITGSVPITTTVLIMPLYDLPLAAQLIPCKLCTLKWRLVHHKETFKAVYRREGTGRRVRLMSAAEILRMRALMLKGPGLEDVILPYNATISQMNK